MGTQPTPFGIVCMLSGGFVLSLEEQADFNERVKELMHVKLSPWHGKYSFKKYYTFNIIIITKPITSIKHHRVKSSLDALVETLRNQDPSSSMLPPLFISSPVIPFTSIHIFCIPTVRKALCSAFWRTGMNKISRNKQGPRGTYLCPSLVCRIISSVFLPTSLEDMGLLRGIWGNGFAFWHWKVAQKSREACLFFELLALATSHSVALVFL